METLIKFVLGGIAVIVGVIVWQAVVSSFWRSDDTRLVAVVIGVAGIATIVGVIVGVYKKFANGGW